MQNKGETMENNTVKFQPKDLKKILDFALSAASLDETRYQLCGLFFSENKIVSTDGHRCHIQELPFTLPIGSYILPRKICEAVHTLVKGASYVVDLTLDKDRFKFTIDEDISIGAKYVNAEFPRYQQIIPSNDFLDKGFTANRRALVKQLELAYKNTSDSGCVKLVLDSASSSFISKNNDASEAKDFPLKLDPINKNKLTIGFNGKYWLDTLKGMTCNEVTFKGAGELDPMTITGEDKTAVIMPMRI